MNISVQKSRPSSLEVLANDILVMLNCERYTRIYLTGFDYSCFDYVENITVFTSYLLALLEAFFIYLLTVYKSRVMTNMSMKKMRQH